MRQPPNQRLQRTPSAPLSRQPLGDHSRLVIYPAVALASVLGVGCQTIAVKGPTVVAFSPTVEAGEKQRFGSARADFDQSVHDARPCLRAAHVAFYAIRGSSLRIREGGKTMFFNTSGYGGGFGYYIATLNRHEVLGGVFPAKYLVREVSRYFFIIPAKLQPCLPVTEEPLKVPTGVPE